MSDYTADSIVVLTGLEAIRKRPGMYIGNTDDDTGLHNLLWNVLDLTIYEFEKGTATKVDIFLEEDNFVTVQNNGAGIPIDMVEDMFTSLHAGGKFCEPVSSYFCTGMPIPNALSSRLELDIFRDEARHRQVFERGEPISELENLGGTDLTGTKIHFRPDPLIFKQHFKPDIIRERLNDIAALYPGLAINFQDEKIWYPNGFRDYVQDMASGRELLQTSPFYIHEISSEIGVEIAMLWTDSQSMSFWSFVNHGVVYTGVHIDSFWNVFFDTFQSFDSKKCYKGISRGVHREILGAGLCAVLRVTLEAPQFQTSFREGLRNKEANSAIRAIFAPAFKEFLDREVRLRSTLLERYAHNSMLGM